MTIYSFAFKDGGRSPARSVVFDCRKLPNPHRRWPDRTGRDTEVAAYVLDDGYGNAERLLTAGMVALRAGRDVAYGCHGGRHRSVVLAEALAAKARARGQVDVTVRHLALPSNLT